MRSRRGSGPPSVRTNGPSIGKATSDRPHRVRPRRDRHHARRSTPHPATHLVLPRGRHSNQTPAPAPTLAAHHPPAARHARQNVPPNRGATRDSPPATSRAKIGATVHHRVPARAIARHRQKLGSHVTRAIISPIAHPSSPRRGSRSARPRALWKAQPSAHRNGRRSARPNRNAVMWRAKFVTMTTTSAARSTVKPKPRRAACACPSA